MPTYGHSHPRLEETQARATGRDLRVSYDKMVELLRSINGMDLNEARRLLDDVIALRRPIRFHRHVKGLGHRRGSHGWKIGRYPRKAARLLIKILNNAQNNAANKGLDVDSLMVKHAAAHRGPKLIRTFTRAFGRATRKIEQLVHVELVVEERD